MLWIPALLGKPRLVAAGIVVSAISDMADGYASRLLGSRSDYSRQLDAIADSAIMVSSLGWLAVARPGSLRPLRATLTVLGVVAAALLAIQWHRYRMLGALHLDSARAAAVIGHLYVLVVLWTNRSSQILLRLFQLFVTGAIVESAWVILGGHGQTGRSPRPLLQSLERSIRS